MSSLRGCCVTVPAVPVACLWLLWLLRGCAAVAAARLLRATVPAVPAACPWRLWLLRWLWLLRGCCATVPAVRDWLWLLHCCCCSGPGGCALSCGCGSAAMAAVACC